MEQTNIEELQYEPMILHKLWSEHETIQVEMEKTGHGGGDKRLHDKIFRNPEIGDPFGRTAGVRDGAMSILIGIAARRSIENGIPIRIGDLTDLVPKTERD